MTAYNLVNPGSMVAGQPEDISQVLANFTAIQNVLNGNVDDGNIKPGAGINPSKILGYPNDASKLLRGDGAWNPALIGAAAGTSLFASRVAADTNDRWHSLASGQLEWGPGNAAVDANLYRSAAAVLRTDGALSSGAYGISLPASPVDGQEYTLVDSLTNPTYQWRFRYNAGSTSSYKWEFVGGAPKVITDLTAPSTTSSSYVLLSGGPVFTIPRAGEYDLGMSCALYSDTAGGGAGGGVSVPGVGVPAELSASWASFPLAWNGGTFSVDAMRTISSGDVGVYNARIGTTGTAYTNMRTLRVRPRRVS